MRVTSARTAVGDGSAAKAAKPYADASVNKHETIATICREFTRARSPRILAAHALNRAARLER